MKAAFFSRNPLGDGINSLLLSQHLFLNGHSVDTFHDHLGYMQRWMAHLPIHRYPEPKAIPSLLEKYELLFVVWDAKTPFITELVGMGKKICPEKVKVFYFYPSKNITREPYYFDTSVNPSLSVAENYRTFCLTHLKLPKHSHFIQWSVPEGLSFQKHKKRVVIHPTGSGLAPTNWPKENFIKLSKKLQKMGYETVFIPGFRDMASWENAGVDLIDFPTLDGLACYLYESGYLIGSDSGPGHLASALGIPTVTICRRKTLADLWAPGFAPNIAIAPSRFIPNISGFRLRDRHWKKFITVSMAHRAFKKLLKNGF